MGTPRGIMSVSQRLTGQPCLCLPLRLAIVWVAAQEQKDCRSSKETGTSFNPTGKDFHFVMPELHCFVAELRCQKMAPGCKSLSQTCNSGLQESFNVSGGQYCRKASSSVFSSDVFYITWGPGHYELCNHLTFNTEMSYVPGPSLRSQSTAPWLLYSAHLSVEMPETFSS